VTFPRTRRRELMDRPEADPEQLSRSLVDLAGVNRWLGGRRSALRLVLRLARNTRAEPVRVLDVGTGGADIPLALARAGRRAGRRLCITATDLHPVTLEVARRATRGEPDVRVAEADAMRLPFDDGSFEIAMCCTTLHHFERDQAIRILGELARVATVGVVVTDLSRSWPALLGARILAATLWRRHPITRHDGPASIRAAFTASELGALGRAAWGSHYRVRRHPVFRLSLVHEPGAGRR
jgi:SAM-dependent methyltransferase